MNKASENQTIGLCASAHDEVAITCKPRYHEVAARKTTITEIKIKNLVFIACCLCGSMSSYRSSVWFRAAHQEKQRDSGKKNDCKQPETFYKGN